MTTTAPAAADRGTKRPDSASLRGLAPRGMWWVAWRQHRALLLVCLGGFAVLGVALLWFRFGYQHALASVKGDPATCHNIVGSGGSALCEPDWAALEPYFTAWSWLRLPLLGLPVLIGAFAGAALVSQERDRGTHVFALTQSVGRTRWYLTKCAVVAIPLLLAQLAIGQLAWWASNDAALYGFSRMGVPFFQSAGPVPAAFLALAFGLAIPIGAYLRSTFPAVVVALAVAVATVTGLGYAWYTDLVPHDRMTGPAVGVSDPEPPAGSLYLDGGFAGADGRVIVLDQCPPPESDSIGQTDAEFDACLAEHGITQRYVTYIAPGRYTQLVATLWAIVAAVAAGGIALGWRRIRRAVL